MHLFGAYQVTCAAYALREQGYGRIVMTASGAGIYGMGGEPQRGNSGCTVGADAYIEGSGKGSRQHERRSRPRASPKGPRAPSGGAKRSWFRLAGAVAVERGLRGHGKLIEVGGGGLRSVVGAFSGRRAWAQDVDHAGDGARLDEDHGFRLPTHPRSIIDT